MHVAVTTFKEQHTNNISLLQGIYTNFKLSRVHVQSHDLVMVSADTIQKLT